MSEEQVIQTGEAVQQTDSASVQTPEQLAAADEQKRQAEEAERREQEEVEKKPWFQKRFDKLTRQRYEAEERAKLAAEENERLKRELESRKDSLQTTAQTQSGGKPNIDQFETYEDYLDALTDWKYEQRDKEAAQKREQAKQQEELQRNQMSFQQKLAATVADGKLKFQDWESVVPIVPPSIMTQPMISATVELSNGSAVAYYLAKNLQEAERISKLSPFAMAAELGKIEAKITKHEPKQTNAPPPLNPLGGSRPASGEIDPEKNPDEWIKARNEGRI